MNGRRLVVCLLLAASALLAGCSGNESDAGMPSANDGTPLGTPRGLNGSVQQAPAWQLGQYWVRDWDIGTTTTLTLKNIVVENTTSDYLVATDNEQNAAFAASFFFNDIGRMSKADWTVRDGPFSFPWYDFPLEDGKTWSAQEQNLGFDLAPVTRDLQLTATAADSGRFIIDVTEGGAPRARYDYDPELQWFRLYESLSAGDDGTPVVEFTVTTTSAGTGFAGTYYHAAGEMVLSTQSVVAPVGQSAAADPYSSFTIGPDATHVLAIVFAFAAPGASHTQLVAPDGQHWEATGAGDADGNTLAGTSGRQIFVPAVAGQWHFATAGAGAFVFGGGGFAWSLVMATGELASTTP